MPRKTELIIYLVHWTLHTYLTVSSAPRFVDTLPSFTDPEGIELSHMVVDTQNGDVFVAGRNVLYHFSADLELKQSVRTGPVDDAPDCSIPPNSCEVKREPKDNDNYLLKMVDFLGSPPKLLLCGSVYKKLCQIRPTDNLYEVHWVHPRNDSLGYNLGLNSNRALFGRGHNGQWTLYTAHTITDNALTVPAVSGKVLVKENNGYHFRYPLQSDSASSFMFINNIYMRQIMGDGFEHDGYVYFVVRYFWGFNSLPVITRLFRICTADVTFQSYAELPIECIHQGRVIKASFTAFYGDSPSSPIEKSLYVAYKNDNTSWGDPGYKPETALCIFSMTSIVAAFDRTPRYCERKMFEEMCDRKEKKDKGSICGTLGTPYLIKQPLYTNSSVSFLNTRLETITTLRKYSKVFVIGGVHDGTVIKMSFSTGNIISKTYVLDKNTTIHNSINTPYVFGKRFVFDRKGDYIYILTGNKIIKYPVASCGVHETCNHCLTHGYNDPLQCGWCAGRCTSLEECSNTEWFSRDTCSPSIDEVSPQYGTVQGGDIIHITGESFGFYIDDEHNSVTIAGIPCKVSVWNNTDVHCILGSALEEISGTIQLNVTSNFSSDGYSYIIKGSTVGVQNFSYFSGPRLYGIHPNKGPISGGTSVTIFGENLDYGDKEPIFSVNKRRCTLIELNKNTALCMIENKSSSGYPDTIALHINGMTYVMEENSSSTFNIAGLSKSFEFTPDPEIHQIQPQATTMSGLTNVTATGIYLNSVQFPKLVVEVSKDLDRFEEHCWSDPESRGTLMTCRTPSLLNMSGVPTPNWTHPLQTHVSFIMDGVIALKEFHMRQEELSRLTYFPDPEFDTVITFGVEMLEIKGNHLNMISTDDNFNIRLGDDYFCKIRTVSMENIKCDIPPNLILDSTVAETNISVEVFIGYSRHHLGYITIRVPVDVEDTLTTTLSPFWWILLCLILICVILVASLGFKYWKTKSLQYIEEINQGYNDNVINDYHSLKTKDVRSSAFAAILQSYAAQDESEGNQMTDMQMADGKMMALLEDKNLIISRSCLAIGENVGSGQFGCVFEGLLKRPEQTEYIKVAIKTLREHTWSNPITVESFLKEALIMKDFNHPNVLSLLGVCFEGSGPSIVLPFMENGDLCSYVRDETKVTRVPDLLKFAVDVASGMAYLASKKFLHRDLAARNCILDSSLTVKVADFGLTRGIYGSDYYCCENQSAKLPHRWMAPESLEKQMYSTKTDVWSYGVLLWEIMTRGSVPYASVGNWDVLEYVKLGNRLDHPKHCPKSLYMVMLACWHKESKKRPDFDLLHECISHIRQKLLEREQKKAPPKGVPAQHAVYFNSRELSLRITSRVLNKEILQKLDSVRNEDLDMSKE